MEIPLERIEQRKYTPEQNIGRLFLQAQRDYRMRALKKLHGLGYSDLATTHISVLSHLDGDKLRLVVLAERMDITKQSMSDLVSDLEQRGYIQRRPDPLDKRAAIICLTEAGEKCLADMYLIKDEIDKEYAALIGEDGLGQLAHLLRQLIRNEALG